MVPPDNEIDESKRVIQKSTGVTPAEQYLVRLCEHSFLSLWSYPGVYRDQTPGRGSEWGKEVCDLLVVFENHILIFSDKHCKFPNTGNLYLDWSRWVRKAVLESGGTIIWSRKVDQNSS